VQNVLQELAVRIGKEKFFSLCVWHGKKLPIPRKKKTSFLS
jgi:hypothetical protein